MADNNCVISFLLYIFFARVKFTFIETYVLDFSLTVKINHFSVESRELTILLRGHELGVPGITRNYIILD